ncbi:MAG: Smr/MutS family protein, partial [Chloroflexi bacterium]|nr:Smr/MutS family protein [Chloroflexota bacterium]
RCIGSRGEIRDHASPLLHEFRRTVRETHDRLVDRLHHLVGSQRAKTVLQEGIITQRHGRYVVPVKSDFKGEFRGVVHDVSSSGATLFMEPLETLDLGNAWREAQLLEEREVERILRRLAGMVGERYEQVVTNVECLARLDLNLAMARYEQRFRGSFPELAPLTPEPRSAADGRRLPRARRLKLVDARHPLLTGHVVPISVEIAGDVSQIVITGPNTGGKTVALKTMGLLSIMALCGMPLPAAEGTVIPAFESIFADIGDEQSIEQSLSTFSSHLGNIINILREVQDGSLVLLDELGAGTDPEEGSALARSLLSDLLERGAMTVATTHHSELKAFAHGTPGIRNASVEFDVETLSPTYHLTVGLPGRSNAIAIAQRLGLPEQIVSGARLLLSPAQLQVEELLTDLKRERDQASALRHELQIAEIDADQARREAQRVLMEAQAERSRMIQQAREQVTDELHDMQRRLRRAQNEMEMIPAPSSTEGPPSLAELRPGVMVLVRGLGQQGEVLNMPNADGEVDVAIGMFKAKVRADQLERIGRRSAASQGLPPPITVGPAWTVRLPPVENPGNELHLRGLTVDAAIETMDKYLHDAYLAGQRSVRLIHGKGTGALRRAVRDKLGDHPLVRAFTSGEQSEGGDGVTVAELVA